MKKYVDPLHVPYEKLVVTHRGKERILINKRLLDQQNCWENLEEIKALHKTRLELEDIMKRTKSPKSLKTLDKLYTCLEYKLQDLWGFDQNSTFHRHWTRPKCKCPSMDNEERYPTGVYIVNQTCPLHNFVDGFLEEKEKDNDKKKR